MTSSSDSTTTTSQTPLPTIHLLCMLPKYITAFHAACIEYKLPPNLTIQIHEGALSFLPKNNTLNFDCIVSPANSYARLDGGFDDALSRAFSPKNDYMALTRLAQDVVWKEWRGFAPPSSCTLVDLAGSVTDRTEDGEERVTVLPPNPWGCRYMALVPTMKIPQRVTWDREVVYECMWALWATIDKHNRGVDEGVVDEGMWIDSVLLTPFATGCGMWNPERWAAQLVLSLRHFVDAQKDVKGWGRGQAGTIMGNHEEVEKTYDL